MLYTIIWLSETMVIKGESSGPVWGTRFWPRGPNLPPFSTFYTDLGRFILKLLNLDIYFLFMFIFYSCVVVFSWANILSERLGNSHVDAPGSALDRSVATLWSDPLCHTGTKPGDCPYLWQVDIEQKNRCSDDTKCSGNKKCCVNELGFQHCILPEG